MGERGAGAMSADPLQVLHVGSHVPCQETRRRPLGPRPLGRGQETPAGRDWACDCGSRPRPRSPRRQHQRQPQG